MVASLFTLGDGCLFADRYQIRQLLGKGGMGTVYEAVHLPTARRRALKIMSYQLAGSPTRRQRFTREAQLGARIGSPFIVDVLDAGVDEVTGFPYIAMERLAGEDLARLSRREGPLRAVDTVGYLYQAALALQSCHAAGVVHRDVKPSNLFLVERPDGQQRIKLLDLGIAKLVADGEAMTTDLVGTPAYMAPEQLAAGGRVTAATDGYALAMVGYTLLVGRGYFQDEAEPGNVFTLADVIRSGAREPATVRAARANATLPPAVDAVFSRGTAAAPADRYPSAVEMVEALAAALDVPLPVAFGLASAAPIALEPALAVIPPEVTTLGSTTSPQIASVTGRRAPAPSVWLVAPAAVVFALLIPLLGFRRPDPRPRLVPAPTSMPTPTKGAPVAAEIAAARPGAVPAPPRPTITSAPSSPLPSAVRRRRASKRAHELAETPRPDLAASPLYSRD